MDNNEVRVGQENILPEAKGLFQALRDMGYENTAAIADLVDNSIDAGATNIRITVSENMQRIYLADDGIGMSPEVLNTAIKLGGKKAHNDTSDLGKYGLGLITASLSLGKIIRVITKNGNKYNSAVLDYDVICETNKFVADFHESNNAEKEAFDFRTHNAQSGTIIIIDKCDSIQYTKAKDLVAALESNLGQVFRTFLKNGKRIYINDVQIIAIDPLFQDLADVTNLVDENVEVCANGVSRGIMHVLAVEIPDQKAKRNKALRLNIQGQGFYILRNNREIASALEFQEIFKKHNDFNLLRIEVSFSPELDSLMGINIKKHDVVPSEEVINALNTVLSEPIKKLRTKMKNKQKKIEAENPFLDIPTITNVAKNSEIKSASIDVPTISARTTEKETSNDIGNDCEFQFSSFAGDETDSLFKTSISGNKVIVRYNLCNHTYKNNILNSEDGIRAKQELDKIIESCLRAYIEVSDVALLDAFANALANKL